eukprot:TRINITY_DN2541_c0_g1_i1.p1 TRINITY_DN2541_c0_g1~~TRINITY_DN2541_c0_g1_i1.p1  ORF type:complete len:577 (-),score=169.98 TRINITY_DN2541_c0_g1_i1:75-1805(-)
MRRFALTAGSTVPSDTPLEVRISIDKDAKTLTIQDTGIGMTREELVKNLGTIAHSGSRAYMQKMEQEGVSKSDANIIGQFGVGFYSAFVVADKVTVYSNSASSADGKAWAWTSDGTGSYELSEAEGVARGTKIVIHLKEDCTQFTNMHTVESIVKKYSNFVGFPILVDGKRVNTVQAVWTMPKNEVTDQMHTEFYQFVAHAWDEPRAHLHFQTDQPVSIQSLFYLPQSHSEKYGLGRMDPGVHLYSRKVMIQQKAQHLLPPWLRFVKGVVDSEDIPLNISREHLQDSALIKRIGNVLTKRILKWIGEMGKDKEKYNDFYKEFNFFLKEGMWSDQDQKDNIAPLLRYETTRANAGELVSLDEYVERMPASQTDIYYICSPNRDFALSSPYYEVFKEKGYEVLIGSHPIDEIILQQIGKFKEKSVIAAEAANLQMSATAAEKLSDADSKSLSEWLENTLGKDRVASVATTTRVASSPAIINKPENAMMRKMMKLTDAAAGGALSKHALEINPAHPIIRKLNAARTVDESTAKAVAEQIFDNALIAAGLLDDPRSMLTRLNTLLEKSLDAQKQATSATQ